MASVQSRHADSFCQSFAGLEEGANRYDLLLLVKKVGQQAGFTPRMIQLLDYYMAFTRDIDWEEGSRPIVYQSLSRTALDLGISERQVQKLEQGLFQLGVISWNDSGNYKRYGQRHPTTGRILYAFGVELTPLAQLKVELEAKLAEKQQYDDAWMETKRQISWYRSQIRAATEGCREEGADETELVSWQARYEEIAVAIRSYLDLSALHQLLARHKSLLSELQMVLQSEEGTTNKATQRQALTKVTNQMTSSGEQEFVHIQPTTQQSFDKSNPRGPAGEGFQESVPRPVVPTGVSQSSGEFSGLEHVTIGVAIQAASERFRGFLPEEANWLDVVNAASHVRTDLKISQSSWGEACLKLGRTRAALCVLVTDQGCLREVNSVEKPAAYFRGLVNRAGRGELQLHRTLFGLLKRGQVAE